MCKKDYVKIGRCLLLGGVAAFSFAGCSKSSNTTQPQYEVVGTTNATDYSHVEIANSDVESMSDLSAVIEFGNTSFYGQGYLQLEMDFDNHHFHHDGDHNGDDGDDFSHCAEITFNGNLLTRTLTIDFGASGCTGADGTNRKGQVIISFGGFFFNSGSSRTITFNNYYVNGNQITGSKTVTYMGLDSSGHPYFDVNVNDTLWLGSNNGYISYNSQHTRTWIQGYDTYTRSDDVFQITGSATVKEANGDMLNIAITTPLQLAPLCKWVEAGIVTIVNQTASTTETINYGSGNCDSEAQLTVNGHTYNITLN